MQEKERIVSQPQFFWGGGYVSLSECTKPCLPTSTGVGEEAPCSDLTDLSACNQGNWRTSTASKQLTTRIMHAGAMSGGVGVVGIQESEVDLGGTFMLQCLGTQPTNANGAGNFELLRPCPKTCGQSDCLEHFVVLLSHVP